MNDDHQALSHQLALGPGVRILEAHPCGLIALEKPPGIKAHPNPGETDENCLIQGAYDPKRRRYHHLRGTDCLEEVFLIHRLDSPTSGVILVGTQQAIYEAAVESFKRKRVKKSYHALLRGLPKPLSGTWVDPITRKNQPKGPVRIITGDDQTARTDYRLLRMDENRFGLTLVLLQPLTGRTHQLRFQCMKHGCPILGDRNYGDFNLNHHFAKIKEAQRLFLHASSIELDLFKGTQRMTFTAESSLPQAFETLLFLNKDAQKTLHERSREDLKRMQQKRIWRSPAHLRPPKA